MNFIGSAVISNTHIREVSNLLFKDNEMKQDNFKLDHVLKYEEHGDSSWNKNHLYTDLFALIDCVILNNKLYTLPATIVGQKNTLWDILVQEDVCETLDTSKYNIDIGKSIISQISQFQNFTKVAGSADEMGKVKIEHNKILNEIKEFYDQSSSGALGIHKLQDPYNFGIGGGSSRVFRANTIENMARELIGWMDYQYSGAYEACTSALRDMYYIFSAELLEVPYYIQSTRLEFADNFPNYFDLNFKTKLYTKLSVALDETISNVYDDFSQSVAFIPPFSSIVLDRSNKPEDIINVALELRSDFEKTRKGFNDLEKQRRNSKNLKERAKIKMRQRELLEDASKSFTKLSRMNLKSTIRYIPEVIKPITNPANPTKYSANLLMQPIELIIEWWRKRPIKKKDSVQDKIFQIEEYHELLNKFFPDKDEH